MGITENIDDVAEPKPISAKLATKPINLIQFAKLAGKNMLEVIPIETTQQTGSVALKCRSGCSFCLTSAPVGQN